LGTWPIGWKETGILEWDLTEITRMDASHIAITIIIIIIIIIMLQMQNNNSV
jgi:uncharacterized integral membrane protein